MIQSGLLPRASADPWDSGCYSLVSSLSPSCLDNEFYPCPSPLGPVFTNVASHPLFSEHEGPHSAKQKLLQAQEAKVQILMVIQASLPVIGEEAILWATRLLDADVAVITGVTTIILGGIRGSNFPKSWGPCRDSSTSPDYPWLPASLSSASWIPLQQWWRLNI